MVLVGITGLKARKTQSQRYFVTICVKTNFSSYLKEE